MKFVLQTPSLQHLAGIKTVAALWNQPDILKLIAELTEEIEEDDAECKAVREKVESHVLALELTHTCKQQLLKLIKPLGREILVWCHRQYLAVEDNYHFPLLRGKLPKKFCWTTHGVIDYAKTAQVMTKDDSFTFEGQYEIACMNCLEDEARALFPRVPEEGRLEYINTSIDVDNGSEHPELVVYFSCILSDDLNLLNRSFQQLGQLSLRFSIHLHLFINSLCSSNRGTIEYFFNKLKQGEKEFMLGSYMAKSVIGAGRDRPHCNLLYYMSRMNEEQQRRMFQDCISDVLICLLQWPMQSLFVEAAECGRRYMLCGDYEKVLCAITRKISDGCQDYNYSQLFWECWRLSPNYVKRGLLHDVDFLERLNDTKKKEFIQLIFNEAPSHQINALIYRCLEKFRVILEENTIPDAVLLEWKETAALNSEKDNKGDKRVKREIIRLIDMKMESGKKRRLV